MNSRITGLWSLVAAAEIDRRLVLGRMECALSIDFHVQFEFWRELVADNQAGDPAVWSFVHGLITHFVVHIDRAEFLGKFEGQKKD